MKRLLKRWLVDPAIPVSPEAQRVDEGRTDWKARAAEAISRAKSFEADAREQAKRAERFKAVAEKLRRRESEIEQLRERLAVAERELSVAREHLMAVEVKLDILEGAANVLDLRTRSAVPSDRRETGAPV